MKTQLTNLTTGLEVLPYVFRRKLMNASYLMALLFVSCFNNGAKAGIVTNLNNTGAGSLRAVIAAAVTGEVITFQPSLISSGSVKIYLTSEITTSVSITINGLMTSTDTLYLSGSNTNRIFNAAATMTVNNLAFINANNNAGNGGAIFCQRDLRVSNCVFTGNSAMNGASIYLSKGSSSGSVVATNCTFYNNSTIRRAAAIYAESGLSTANSVVVTLHNSTIYGNSSGWGGTAIYCAASISSANFPGAVNATINVNQSTICDNSGGTVLEIYTNDQNNSASTSNSYFNIANSTVFNNGGTSISSTAGNVSTISIISSIIFDGIFNNQSPKVASGGKNLFSVAGLTGSVSSDAFSVTTASVNLGPLAFNGGLTKTRLPLQGSIAINNGSSSTVNAQNGPIVGIRDIGAAEQRSTFATQTVTNCGPYTWINGITYTLSNSVDTYTIPNVAGNDSIINLNLTVLPNYNTTSTISMCPGSTYAFGTQTLTTSGTYTASFTAKNGCDSTVTLSLTLNDAIAPFPNLATLANITSQCSVNSLTAPTATDNCAGTIIGIHNVILPIIAQGTTIVTWTYNDGNGNTSTQTQSVVITDNIAPVASTTTLANITNQCSVTSLIAPTANDNCTGTIIGTHNASLPITTQGTTSVIWTYNDGHGNTSTQTQNIIVTLPVATTTLSGLTITATNSGASYQWIDCANSNQSIAGETNQSFTASANGNYAVIVTQNSCSDTSACVNISSVGIREVNNLICIKLYPNPTNGSFTVSGIETNISIMIYNTIGELVKSIQSYENNTTIDLSDYSNSIYFIKIKNSKGEVIQKLIKN